MRNSKIEPKRMTLVYADTDSEPSMALIEGKAGGRSGLLLTKTLIIYRDSSHKEYTDDMNYIMENGSFPSDYKR
jgi:tRNA1(Val) A37 N6-methylase TrmN6